MPRSLAVALLATMGCSSSYYESNDEYDSRDEYVGQLGEGDAAEYTARRVFGGSFELVDLVVDGAEGDEGSSWTGVEYDVHIGADGDTLCGFRWTTDSTDLESPLGCVNCAEAWNVSCHSGRVISGDCDPYMDVQAATTEVMTFALAFHPREEIDGVQHGVVYYNNGGPTWFEMSWGTFDGKRLSYETEY